MVYNNYSELIENRSIGDLTELQDIINKEIDKKSQLKNDLLLKYKLKYRVDIIDVYEDEDSYSQPTYNLDIVLTNDVVLTMFYVIEKNFINFEIWNYNNKIIWSGVHDIQSNEYSYHNKYKKIKIEKNTFFEIIMNKLKINEIDLNEFIDTIDHVYEYFYNHWT